MVTTIRNIQESKYGNPVLIRLDSASYLEGGRRMGSVHGGGYSLLSVENEVYFSFCE